MWFAHTHIKNPKNPVIRKYTQIFKHFPINVVAKTRKTVAL
jgi:hypothetical protein